MFVPVHTEFVECTQTGQQLKAVICEKCATHFCYSVSRSVTVTDGTLYGIGARAMQRHVEKAARHRLARRLDREVELVPCPRCHWVNTDLIAEYRKYSARGWYSFAFAAALFGALTLAIIAFDAPAHFSTSVLGTVLAVTSALMIAAFLLQRLQRLRINPNRHRNGRPILPPGTPPALLPQTLPSGEVAYAPVPSEFTTLQAEPEWATFRAGQTVFEPWCCVCLTPACTPLKLPFTFPTEAPACDTCTRALRVAFWKKSAASLLFIAPLTFCLGLLVPKVLFPPAIGLLIFMGILLWVLASRIIAAFNKPYRLRTVDRDRGIRQMRFRNPAYTALLLRRFGQADGRYPTPH